MLSRLALLVSVLALPACQLFGGSSPSSTQENSAALTQLDAYIELANQLANADEAGRNALYLQVSENYASAPTETAKLNLALVLGTVGHAHTDMERADQLLLELEAVNDQLPPVTGSLVRMRRAMFSLTRTLHGQLRTLSRENKNLRKELDEAETKIKALTAIERKLDASAAAPRKKP